MKEIKTKRYIQAQYDVDFEAEQSRARRMNIKSLFAALKDAIEASRVSPNAGKYFDQASVYRQELGNRGYSISEQDKILENTPSSHSPPDISSRQQAVENTRGAWEGLTPQQFTDITETNRHDF